MRSLTIAIEASAVAPRGAERAGMHRYLDQLLRGFRAVGTPNRFRLWVNSLRPSRRNGIWDYLEEVGWSQVDTVVSRFPARFRQRLDLPVEWFTGAIDVFHGPNHLLPRLGGARGVVTIHDLAFLKMMEPLEDLNPDWVTAIRRRSPRPAADLAAYRARCNFFLDLRREVPRTLARADRILTVSETTAQDLVELAGIHRERIRVVPIGLKGGLAPIADRVSLEKTLDRLGLHGSYILYVGVLEPNKDLHTLIRGYAMTSPVFQRDHRLVIAGPHNWFLPVLQEAAGSLGVEDRVLFPGYIPEAALSVLYSGSAATVCPSALEGFGNPVLEAMACGAPVIIADAGALPEVAGDAADRVPPSDPAAMAAAMERVVGDTGLAADLVVRGFNRCRAFSWERTAKMTLDVYSEVAG